MAHDVLISYSSKDKKIADAICNRFEANKIKVWMAPRDIIPGKSYAAEISRAIKNTKFVVLLFNNNSFSSQWVRKEIERAVGNGKLILPFLLEKIELDDEWDLYISSAHWLDAMNDDIEKSINNLLASVAKILEINKEEQIISEHEEDTNIITKEILDEEKRKVSPKNNEETLLQNTELKQKSITSKKVQRYVFLLLGVLTILLFLWIVNQKGNKSTQYSTTPDILQDTSIVSIDTTHKQSENSSFNNSEKEETINSNPSPKKLDNIVSNSEKRIIEEYDNLIKYSDLTIIDTKTNLMWMVKDFSTIEGRFLKNASWDEAMSWAKKINQQNYAGHNDWKVPSIKEYRSINNNNNDRRIYSLLFEDQGAYSFWSRNEISSEVKSYISFDEGFATSGSKEGQRNAITNEIFKFSVRLVREIKSRN